MKTRLDMLLRNEVELVEKPVLPTDFQTLEESILSIKSIYSVSDKKVEELMIAKSKLDKNFTESGVKLWVQADLLLDSIMLIKNQGNINNNKRKKIKVPQHLNSELIKKLEGMIEKYRIKNGVNKVFIFSQFLNKLQIEREQFPDFVREIRGNFQFEVYVQEGVEYIELIPFGREKNRFYYI